MRNKYRLSFFILIIILFFSSFLRAAITKQELPSVLSKEQFEKWSANPKAPFIYINKKLFKEKRQQQTTNAVLRKRSMDSIARPKATKNITSSDPRLQGI